MRCVRTRSRAVVAALAVLLVGCGEADRELDQADERPAVALAAAPAATGGFARQRSLLGVLRDRRPRDNDPQVSDSVREWRRYVPRRGYVRLLAKAPSGSAFVLVPVKRYHVTIEINARGDETARAGLCLWRRGTHGGAGVCGSTDDLLAGRLWGVLAGQVYGVVPDRVSAVRPLPGAQLVPVHRNFYVYDDPRERGPIPPPAWCYDTGRCVATHP
jgi:hypothetical protein